jgi:hypothetical protein
MPSLPQFSGTASAIRQTATSQGIQRTDRRTKLLQPASFPQPSTPVFPQGRVARSLLQLDLLPDTLPLEAIYATPSACKQPNGGNWWNLRCGHNQKMFGGLYSAGERDQILRHFKGRREKIEPREFGIVAERIIAATNLQRRAA